MFFRRSALACNQKAQGEVLFAGTLLAYYQENGCRMKIRKTLIIIFAAAVGAAVILQLGVKYTASNRIEAALREQIQQIGLPGLSFGSLSIDLFERRASITDISTPLYLQDSIRPAGTFTARAAQLKFSLYDALSFLVGEQTIRRGEVSLLQPSFTAQETGIFSSRAEYITLDFQGRITASNISQMRSGSIEEFLQEEQTFIVKLGEFSLTRIGSTLLPVFLSSLNTREAPVSGFEIAFLSSALLPDIPITRTFIEKVSSSSVMINPQQFSRVAEKTLKILGLEWDESGKIESDGVVRATARGGELELAGILFNELGNIDVHGFGELDKSEASNSLISELSLEITNLDADLSDMIGRETITLTLLEPVALKQLLFGVYSF